MYGLNNDEKITAVKWAIGESYQGEITSSGHHISRSPHPPVDEGTLLSPAQPHPHTRTQSGQVYRERREGGRR
jgi:hypothetical protein